MKYTNSDILEMMVKTGLRPTAQRIAVISYIGNHRTHPTADELYTAMSPDFPSLSLTTVYNSIKALMEAGLIRELAVDAVGKRYDLAPLPRHSHFICDRCGKIYDMSYPSEIKLDTADGFDISEIDVYLHGICPKCKKTHNL